MPRRRLESDPRQTSIQFYRADQLAILRKAKLPKVKIELSDGKTKTVKPRDLIDVLRVLDDHGQACWPSLATIAAEARMAKRTVVRAISALEISGLVCVEKVRQPNGSMRHIYTIPWNDLALLCPDFSPVSHREPAPVPQGEPSRVPTCNSASSQGGTVSAQEAPKEATPQPPKGEWQAVVDSFKRDFYNIDHLVAVYQNTGRSPAELRQDVTDALAIVDLPENTGRVKSRCGAVLRYLERGLWPVDGLPTLEQYRRYLVAIAESKRLEQERRQREAEYDRIVALDRQRRMQAKLQSATGG